MLSIQGMYFDTLVYTAGVFLSYSHDRTDRIPNSVWTSEFSSLACSGFPKSSCTIIKWRYYIDFDRRLIKNLKKIIILLSWRNVPRNFPSRRSWERHISSCRSACRISTMTIRRLKREFGRTRCSERSSNVSMTDNIR